MRKSGKFYSALIVILAGIISLAAPLFAEEDKPTCDASIGVFSQYIWRGYEFSKDSAVIFPSMTVSYKGFAFNMWGDLDTNFVGATNDNATEMFETDYTLSYKNSISMLNYSLGWIYYDVDGAEDQEVFVVLGLATLLSPEISVFRGIEHSDAWYLKFALSHSFKLENDWSVNVGTWVGFYDLPHGDPDTGGSYSEFHDATVWVALNIPLTSWATLTPSLNYSFPLSDKAKDHLETANLAFADDESADFLYGGVTLAISF